MADIRTVFMDLTKGADFAIDQMLLDEDDSLATAIILSLFTDARAAESDVLPGGSTDRRGWWGQEYALNSGDNEGSLLWLLLPGKQMQENVTRAEQYITDALAWLRTDGLAGRLDVVCANPRDGVLSAAISIYRPNGVLDARYELLWSL